MKRIRLILDNFKIYELVVDENIKTNPPFMILTLLTPDEVNYQWEIRGEKFASITEIIKGEHPLYIRTFFDSFENIRWG